MDWNGCYADGVTPWDKGEAAPPLWAWLDGGGRFEGRVLVPGCGTGHDAALIAGRCPGVEVVAVDVAPLAVERARARYGGQANLRFVEGDVFAMGGAGGDGEAFDVVFEHTCFCAIDPGRRAAYVAALERLLRPGGVLWAIFFLDPYDDEHRPGGGPPHGVGVDELDRLFGRGFVVVDGWVPEAAYEGREGRELVRVCERRGG